MHDLLTHIYAARAVAYFARDELRMAAAEHTARDTSAALHLVQLAAGVAAATRHLPRNSETPAMPDLWVVAAGEVHEAVAQVFDGLLRLWEAAEKVRVLVPVPAEARVEPGDADLFGREPEDRGHGGWTGPNDLWALRALVLAVGSPAWTRRAAIVVAANGWTEEHQLSLAASGVIALHDGMRDLNAVMAQIRCAMADVPASTVAAARAKAKVAARSLIELGDDPAKLSNAARLYAGQQDGGTADHLAWAAVGDLLAAAERA